MFKQIARAYEVLSNDALRARYDRGEDLDAPEAPAANSSNWEDVGGSGFGNAGFFPGGGFGANDFFGDDFGFFASPFGAQRQRRRGDQRGARQHAFADPFELFASFFGATDPFSVFDEEGGFGQPHRRANQQRRATEDPMERMMAAMMGGQPFGMAGGAGTTFSSFSSSSIGGGGRSVSKSSTTTIVNGKKVTKTTTRTTDARGNVNEDVEEQVEDLPYESRNPRLEYGSDNYSRRGAPAALRFQQW